MTLTVLERLMNCEKDGVKYPDLRLTVGRCH